MLTLANVLEMKCRSQVEHKQELSQQFQSKTLLAKNNMIYYL